MQVLHADAPLRQSVTQAVRELEKQTAAEVVVVLAARSGSYRDVAYLAGAAVAWATLLFFIVSPSTYSPFWVPVETAALFAAAAWLVHRTPALVRLLTSGKRREAQVTQAAEAAFVEERVDRTRERTGILVYVSLLERRLTILPDAGIDGRVAPGHWRPVDLRSGEDVLAELKRIGEILAQKVPSTGSNPDELPDEPRVRA
jgi:putative membrane protein